MTYNTFYVQREKGGEILWEVFLSIKRALFIKTKVLNNQKKQFLE